MPRAAAAQGKLEKEDVDVRKGFLLAVALVAFLFPLGAGAAEKVWSNSVPERRHIIIRDLKLLYRKLLTVKF